MASKEIRNIVVVSDLHSGCKLGLCPPGELRLDDGGFYRQSEFQKQVWKHWQYFWEQWVPDVVQGDPYAVIVNGDALDGVHHNSTTQISHNLLDQRRIAKKILTPVVDKCEGRFYMIRGTEAHVGRSATDEEELAEDLGAIPNKVGQYSRYDLWKYVGPKVVHALHHVGTTGSAAYEATAVHKELTESFVEAGRWNRRPPDVIVRSHRHRHIEIRIAVGGKGNETSSAIAVVTPAWQGKTPFAWKVPGARLSQPQFGGIVIRYYKNELFVRHKVWSPEPDPVE